jgi:long-chain acyl-CoA synthetase
MHLAQLLHRAARKHPGQPAIRVGARVWASYGDLARRCAVLAARLSGRFGLRPGDRVALAMLNDPAFIEVLLACWQAGLAAVPMNAKLHPKELRYILDHSGARLCFATTHLADAIGAEMADADALEALIEVTGREYADLLTGDPAPGPAPGANDLAWLFYTSGTTGRPKGAMLSHRNLLAMTEAYFADVDGIAPGDCILHAAPLSHGSGLYGLPHLAAGACQVIPESRGFEPAEIFGLLPDLPGLTCFAAPTMVKRLVDCPLDGDIGHLKTVVYGGGPMYVSDLKRGLARFGNRFVQIYGQGESPMTITALGRADHAATQHPRYEARLASVGRAQKPVEVRVVGAEDRPLPTGETGEVLVRGAPVMLGYWRDAAASAETLRGGWLHSGDLGQFDEDGYLTLKDRSKDVIISGGANIYPREIEEVLLRHPKVLECSVIGRPHADWGEEVVAFVVPRPGENLGTEELDAICLQEIARFKRPKRYCFVESLPKNNYGKILKTALRELP